MLILLTHSFLEAKNLEPSALTDCAKQSPGGWLIEKDGECYRRILPQQKVEKRRLIARPGDLLKYLIARAGIKQKSGCKCAELQAKMNAWGWPGCIRHRKEIVDWLCQQAEKAGITLSRKSAGGLLVEGLRMLWKAAEKPAADVRGG